MKPDNDAIDLAKFLSRGNKLKIYAGSHIPADTAYQVCTLHAVEGVQNFQSLCSKCGKPIWFSDDRHPGLAKICIPCFLNFAKIHPVETIGTADAIVKSILVPKRN